MGGIFESRTVRGNSTDPYPHQNIKDSFITKLSAATAVSPTIMMDTRILLLGLGIHPAVTGAAAEEGGDVGDEPAGSLVASSPGSEPSGAGPQQNGAYIGVYLAQKTSLNRL